MLSRSRERKNRRLTYRVMYWTQDDKERNSRLLRTPRGKSIPWLIIHLYFLLDFMIFRLFDSFSHFFFNVCIRYLSIWLIVHWFISWYLNVLIDRSMDFYFLSLMSRRCNGYWFVYLIFHFYLLFIHYQLILFFCLIF